MAKSVKLTGGEQEKLNTALQMIGGVIDEMMDRGVGSPFFSGSMELEGESRMFVFRFSGVKKKQKKFLRRRK